MAITAEYEGEKILAIKDWPVSRQYVQIDHTASRISDFSGEPAGI
jgi:hypothetical protein